MKWAAVPVMALTAMACQSGEAAMPDNLQCAAYISAASFEIAEGNGATDALNASEANLAMMWHLNSWAVPQGISEPDAFARLKAEAQRIRDNQSPDEILKQAKSCISNRPG